MKLGNLPSSVILAFLVTTSFGRLNPQLTESNAVISSSFASGVHAQIDRRNIHEHLGAPQAEPSSEIRKRSPYPQKKGGGGHEEPKHNPPPPPPKNNPPPPPKNNPPPPKNNPPPPPKNNPPPPKNNPPPPPKNNPPPPKNPPPKGNDDCHCLRKRALSARMPSCPCWPFSRGPKRNGRERVEATASEYERDIPARAGADRMLQVRENEVAFLVKNKKLAWFTTPNKAVEHTSVGHIKAIGARDVGQCSMVAIANQEGAVVAHLSRLTCQIISKETKLDKALQASVEKEYRTIKDDAHLFFDIFKKDAPQRYTVIIAIGPQTESRKYGEFMADTLFGIKSNQIDRVINLQGNKNKDNDIATFFVDYAAQHARVFHGPTDGHLTEERL